MVVGLALCAGIAAAVGGWSLLRPAPPPCRIPFDGIRGLVEGGVFQQEDPQSGTSLVVRARELMSRDGKVGKVFRSPLRPEVELADLEVELRSHDGTVLFSAAAPRGRFETTGARVVLENPSRASAGNRQIRVSEIALAADGTARLSGAYEVYRGKDRLGRGRNYQGPAARVGLKR